MTESKNQYGALHGYLRLLKFALVLLWCGIDVLLRRPMSLEARSVWRQRMCVLIARAIGLQIDVAGRIPSRGMIVSNHLSYLDAVVLGGLIPGVFVAKSEVKQWPLIGWLTARGGTIYLRRENPRAVAEVNRALSAAMEQSLPVVAFPEGTTTGATEPLPFHPALFDPALRKGEPVWPVSLTYTVDGSSDRVAEDVCYWGDMMFVPHLMRLMRLRNVRAVVQVADEPVFAKARAEAAAQSHAVVAGMLNDGIAKQLRVLVPVVGEQQAAPVQALQH